MTKDTVTRLVLIADEGKVLTNGEVYGTKIFLSEDNTGEEYYEITQEEYDVILEEEKAKWETTEEIPEEPDDTYIPGETI